MQGNYFFSSRVVCPPNNCQPLHHEKTLRTLKRVATEQILLRIFEVSSSTLPSNFKGIIGREERDVLEVEEKKQLIRKQKVEEISYWQ